MQTAMPCLLATPTVSPRLAARQAALAGPRIAGRRAVGLARAAAEGESSPLPTSDNSVTAELIAWNARHLKTLRQRIQQVVWLAGGLRRWCSTGSEAQSRKTAVLLVTWNERPTSVGRLQLAWPSPPARCPHQQP